MEDKTPTPAAPPLGLSLSLLISNIERRRDEVMQQHETARVKCLMLEDDLKLAAATRDDAASRCNELTAQIAYLRGLATQAVAPQQASA